MFLSFYTFIILILQVTDSVDVKQNQQFRSFLEPLKNSDTLPHLKHNVKKAAENKKANEFFEEAKLFDNIREGSASSSTSKASTVTEASEGENIRDLKSVLQKVLEKLNAMDSKSKLATERKASSTVNPLPANSESSMPLLDFRHKKSNEENALRKPRWGQWTSWSSCSVTCGKGREIRWRHCIEECDTAETEMEEKTCQLPACGPGKIFGIKL